MKLRPHQAECAEAIHTTKGLLLRHDLGTGKTLTSIAMFESLAKKHPDIVAHVVVPAKLQENYKKELAMARVNENNYLIFSYDKYIKQVRERGLEKVVLILDEGHVIRNAKTRKARILKLVSERCFRVIIMTGTPLVNYPNDISTLINMVNPQANLETDWSTFEAKYIKDR